MSEANKRETLLPLLDKQQEVIESLVKLCKELLNHAESYKKSQAAI